MSVYPNLQFTRVTQGATMGTTPFRQIHTALAQIEQDLVNAKGGVSTFATFLNKAITGSGQYVYGSHGVLLNVTASQHHNKIHASRHYAGTDAILAGTAVAGLLSTSAYVKIKLVATQSTKNPWEVSGRYTGNSGGRTITLGFRPAVVQIQMVSMMLFTVSPLTYYDYMNEWDAIDGATFAIFHRGHVVQSLAVHYRPEITNSIKITASGFNLGSILNVNTKKYSYIAIKED